MKEITEDTWFKGYPSPKFAKKGEGLCLRLACEGMIEAEKINEISARLFPERAVGEWFNASINVNNHPDTTFDHVEKIIHTYHLEND